MSQVSGSHSTIYDQHCDLSLFTNFSSNEIENLHQKFTSFQLKTADRDNLRNLLKQYNLFFTDEHFENLFLKVVLIL